MLRTKRLFLLRLDLNATAVSAFLISDGKLFQSLIVEGRNELEYSVVRASIVCRSFAFLKLYLEVWPTRG